MVLLQGTRKFAHFPGWRNKFACYSARNNAATRNIQILQGPCLERKPHYQLCLLLIILMNWTHHLLNHCPQRTKDGALCLPKNPISLLDAHITFLVLHGCICMSNLGCVWSQSHNSLKTRSLTSIVQKDNNGRE